MKMTESYVYQEIAEAIRRRIASGELKPGDRLPPVRAMAETWNCTPGTVSRAYSELAQDGLVKGRRGGGTRVAADLVPAESPVWGWATLINQAEKFLLEALGSGHSPAEAEAALSAATARWRELQSQGARQSGTDREIDTEALRFSGSHDLAVELLSRLFTEASSEATLSINFVGSLGGLMALARGEADVAGVHLWDETTDSYNVPFVQRLLPGRRTILLTLVYRSLGIITPPGNPKSLRGLADLTHAGVVFVNRQAGSGTRVWLDAQLKALGIRPGSLRGYEREELTHLGVARCVDQGDANAGLGIFAAASAYGLGFLPLTQEHYQLVFPEAVWHSPIAQSVVHMVGSQRFKEAVAALGGYDTSKTGEQTVVN
jgi:molybdate-binding protein/DNA-binding transcriptional regulator YhcF (GntR family)